MNLEEEQLKEKSGVPLEMYKIPGQDFDIEKIYTHYNKSKKDQQDIIEEAYIKKHRVF